MTKMYFKAGDKVSNVRVSPARQNGTVKRLQYDHKGNLYAVLVHWPVEIGSRWEIPSLLAPDGYKKGENQPKTG